MTNLQPHGAVHSLEPRWPVQDSRFASEEEPMPAFHLATFSADVTPPEGHPLCGGWIEPARAVDDPLRALGVVLLGQGKPVVLCVFDWVALRNDAHLAVRQALADAAHTTLDHVSV